MTTDKTPRTELDICPECEGVIGNAETCGSICTGAKLLIKLYKSEAAAPTGYEHIPMGPVGATCIGDTTATPDKGELTAWQHKLFPELFATRKLKKQLNDNNYSIPLYASPPVPAYMTTAIDLLRKMKASNCIPSVWQQAVDNVLAASEE